MAIPEPIESAASEEQIDFILKILSTNSPSGSEEKVAAEIFEELENRGLVPRYDSAGNVLCETGSGQTSLLLCGHMDTVPGIIPVRREGEMVYGRGACDAKGPLLALLFAFQVLAKEGIPGKIVFAAVTEEELSSAGLAALIDDKIRCNYAIFGEPGGLARVTVGYRGHLTTRIELTTPEVHASAPKLSANSAELLFEIYSKLKDGLGARSNESVSTASVALTEISSGTAHNVIPGRTRATIDVRIPIGETTDAVKKKIKEISESTVAQKTEASISLSFDEPTEPYSVRLVSPLVRAINRSILKTRSKPTLITKSGTGDMNAYAHAFGVDAITYGPGEARLSHTNEEKVSISEILGCSRIIADAARELFRMTSNKE